MSVRRPGGRREQFCSPCCCQRFNDEKRSVENRPYTSGVRDDLQTRPDVSSQLQPSAEMRRTISTALVPPPRRKHTSSSGQPLVLLLDSARCRSPRGQRQATGGARECQRMLT
jgi:hypothetical protein